MFVPNFEAISQVTFVIGFENRPKSWPQKAFHSKIDQVRQNIFHMVICFVIPFKPYQPTFGHDKLFFFFLFFFLNIVLSSSKPQNIEV